MSADSLFRITQPPRSDTTDDVVPYSKVLAALNAGADDERGTGVETDWWAKIDPSVFRRKIDTTLANQTDGGQASNGRTKHERIFDGFRRLRLVAGNLAAENVNSLPLGTILGDSGLSAGDYNEWAGRLDELQAIAEQELRVLASNKMMKLSTGVGNMSGADSKMKDSVGRYLGVRGRGGVLEPAEVLKKVEIERSLWIKYKMRSRYELPVAMGYGLGDDHPFTIAMGMMAADENAEPITEQISPEDLALLEENVQRMQEIAGLQKAAQLFTIRTGLDGNAPRSKNELHRRREYTYASQRWQVLSMRSRLYYVFLRQVNQLPPMNRVHGSLVLNSITTPYKDVRRALSEMLNGPAFRQLPFAWDSLDEEHADTLEDMLSYSADSNTLGKDSDGKHATRSKYRHDRYMTAITTLDRLMNERHADSTEPAETDEVLQEQAVE